MGSINGLLWHLRMSFFRSFQIMYLFVKASTVNFRQKYFLLGEKEKSIQKN